MDPRQQAHCLAEEVICPICLDFFTDPVILECGHNFCRSCITQSWEKREINSCPECRQEFPASNLRVNRALANLAEKARQLKLNPQEKESKPHCEEHQEELKLFCETDKKLIRLICRDSREHKSHNFIAVGIYKILSLRRNRRRDKWRGSRNKISQIQEESRNLQTHITSEFAQMHQILTEKEQHLLRDLREQEENILKPMEEKEEASRIRSISDEIGRTLSPTDGVQSAKKANNLLPFPVWTEVVEAVKPNKVSVTLDVETANPRLEVSEDLKSLRRTRTRRDLPDTGKRFTYWPCALGSEGFTSGRHYWEVEVVGNRRWSLGVASESVERERGVRLIPENGFWIIGRKWDQFYINNTQSPLPVGEFPGKVGVYLSYESGTVSFYNADTKSHLHTFTGNKFTGKLYPFFWSWDFDQFLGICTEGAGPQGLPDLTMT
ncbi:nuclear factor 7, brain-like [Stegostoma tigrinum]|uniref:nuclear factor 7, brain-like n=1 Tax=Stegostoma tigrinum TaxID=3053191 RepID=UPI00286FE007|nr:nuclear factor 7, brain-like [Stegostoma tigrinum]